MARMFVDPEAETETERYARMTSEERLALFLELCDLTDEIQRGRPDGERLRAPAPRTEDSIELWRRLMSRR